MSQEFYEDDEAIQHFGVKGMRWGVTRSPAQLNKAWSPGQEKRLQRLERVNSGKGSTRDKVATAYKDTALGNKQRQLNAQIAAATKLKDATAKGEGVSKALMNYYGTRAVPGIASVTFNKQFANKANSRWTPGRDNRLNRLERVNNGTSSRGDRVATSYKDTALGNKQRQLNAQISAARNLKTASSTGNGTAKALLNYYGTRAVPGIAATTFNRQSRKRQD